MKIHKGNHEVKHENYIPYHSQKLLVESSETNYGGSRRTTISTKYKDNVKRVKLSWKLLQNQYSHKGSTRPQYHKEVLQQSGLNPGLHFVSNIICLQEIETLLSTLLFQYFFPGIKHFLIRRNCIGGSYDTLCRQGKILADQLQFKAVSSSLVDTILSLSSEQFFCNSNFKKFQQV